MSQADNDAFRTTLRGGRVVLTGNVAALSQSFYAELVKAIQTTQDFGNDEHTYGEVTVRGETFFWSIDPGPRPTLTIGHADEYSSP